MSLSTDGISLSDSLSIHRRIAMAEVNRGKNRVGARREAINAIEPARLIDTSRAQCILLEAAEKKTAIDRSTSSDALREACRATRPRISSTNYLIKRRWLDVGAHRRCSVYVHRACVSAGEPVYSSIFRKLETLLHRGREESQYH